MKKNNSLYGLALVVLAQVMVAINIVTSKSLLATLPSLLVLTVRFSLATLFLLLLHWWSPSNKRSMPSYFSQLKTKDWLYIFGQALTAGVFFNLLLLWGLQYTDANNAGIITSVLPLIIAIMSWLILGERFSSRTFLSIVLVTVGLFIISYAEFKGSTSPSLRGSLLILLSLLPEALYYIFSKLYRINLPVFLLSSLLNGINALILLAFIPFHNSHYMFSPNKELFSLVLLGLSTSLFYVFWCYGSEKIEGMMASLSTAIMPVATVLLAGLFLGEQFTLIQFLGMSIIICAIIAYLRA